MHPSVVSILSGRSCYGSKLSKAFQQLLPLKILISVTSSAITATPPATEAE
ncbi:MAG: hypothetical protein LRY40_09490 [Shewanella fodinae]|nr:hypothetical protein [Shewanella fodinae]